MELHSDAVNRLINRGGPPTDDVLREMEERAEKESFPTVGPEVGRTLALITRLLNASSVLELGSGFGYSAYWIVRCLPDDGKIVLTERDSELLDDARTYFEKSGLDQIAVFEHGDALDIAEDYEETFDFILLDHDTSDYVHGFETVRDKVKRGGAVVADNVVSTSGGLEPDDLIEVLEGGPAQTERVDYTADFYEYVFNDPDFEIYIIPVGEGITVSYRLEK